MKRIMWCAAVALAACSEGSITGPDAQLAKATASTAAQALVQVGGSVTYRESGPSRTGVGTCQAGGRWQNTAKGYTSAGAHPNCADVVGGTAVVVQLKVSKNTGATQYNDGTAYVWYRKAIDQTQGDLVFAGSDGWTIAATQALLNDRGNFMNRGGMVVVACNGGSCNPALLSW